MQLQQLRIFAWALFRPEPYLAFHCCNAIATWWRNPAPEQCYQRCIEPTTHTLLFCCIFRYNHFGMVYRVECIPIQYHVYFYRNPLSLVQSFCLKLKVYFAVSKTLSALSILKLYSSIYLSF